MIEFGHIEQGPLCRNHQVDSGVHALASHAVPLGPPRLHIVSSAAFRWIS